MICDKCGRNNPQNGKYCVNCGNWLQSYPPQKQRGADNVIAVIIIILMAVLIVIAGMLIYSFTIENNSSVNSVGAGVGGGSIMITGQESVPNIIEEEETTEERETEVEEVTEPIIISSQERLSKKDEFTAEANIIEEYSRRYLETAATQNEINIESGIVFEKWDVLLNNVYVYLKEILSEQDFEKLQSEELVWIKEKESAIEAAGAAWNGGTGETMARNVVAIKYTRERCYYLIDLIV